MAGQATEQGGEALVPGGARAEESSAWGGRAGPELSGGAPSPSGEEVFLPNSKDANYWSKLLHIVVPCEKKSEGLPTLENRVKPCKQMTTQVPVSRRISCSAPPTLV